MSERKNIAMLAGLVLSVSLFSVCLSVMLLSGYYNRIHFQVLGDICQEIADERPEMEMTIMSVLKEYKDSTKGVSDKNILSVYGYIQTDFLPSAGRHCSAFATVGFLAGGLLFSITLFFWGKKERMRIEALTDYLEKVNTGDGKILPQRTEDHFSRLQDEIYKTVTELYWTREEALRAKNNFAANLYNIAHQIKTPITSISLSLQMMQEPSSLGNFEWMMQDGPLSRHLEQIRRQLFRLMHLEESLLLLSRIDAGTLSLEKKEVDVFTLLELSAENLQELFQEAGVLVEIPEGSGTTIRADLEWTMEAVMNLMKNCIEHTPQGGIVSCSYGQNPLYTQIRITDTGSGFAKEDLPHLFERFYRGKQEKKDGIGIGLALSKAIIESQNGTITAQNLINGGACFEIRFYSH